MEKVKDELEAYFEEREKTNPQFKKAWDELAPERAMTLSMLQAREFANVTQAELSKRTGIDQGNISRIESGNGNPSISTLKRIAKALNVNLRIEFIPKQTTNN